MIIITSICDIAFLFKENTKILNEQKEQKRNNKVIVLTMTEKDFEATTKSNKKNKPINNIESIAPKKRRRDEVCRMTIFSMQCGYFFKFY